MLLTLSIRSLRSRIDQTGDDALVMTDLPGYAINHLKLRGLNIPASMLKGCSTDDLDRLRDHADKAACPCLVLIEDTPLPLASDDPEVNEATRDRVRRLAFAANRLGCNALSLMCEAPDTDEAFDQVAAEMKQLMLSVERQELNLLIAPHDGLTDSPQRLTDLIKRIGGFRIGSLPNFEHAAATGDLTDALRQLAPYAGAIHATVQGFTKAGKHKDYDLAECVNVIRSVGFPNTLAIDYVGNGDPVSCIESARDILQAAIEEE
jgi:sugar phosphate isomerase/epimerase